jgi:hypothetical protein
MRDERGYVLVGTLLLLALMGLVAARLAARLGDLRAQTVTLDSLADGITATHDARALALFHLTTQPVTPLGIGAEPSTRWPVDGRPIRLHEAATATLQDHRGLLGVNTPDRSVLGRLLLDHGVRSDRAAAMLDVLEDYTDTDNLRRLNGAERQEYEVLGLPSPRNDWMGSPEELRQIPLWRDDPALLSRILPLLSGRRDAVMNPNSAPREVLAARFPAAPSGLLDSFIARRTAAPYRTPEEARTATGLAFSDADVFHPGNFYRLRLSMRGLPVALEYNVRLTPESQTRPWQIVDSRAVFIPAPGHDEGSSPSRYRP